MYNNLFLSQSLSIYAMQGGQTHIYYLTIVSICMELSLLLDPPLWNNNSPIWRWAKLTDIKVPVPQLHHWCEMCQSTSLCHFSQCQTSVITHSGGSSVRGHYIGTIVCLLQWSFPEVSTSNPGIAWWILHKSTKLKKAHQVGTLLKVNISCFKCEVDGRRCKWVD